MQINKTFKLLSSLVLATTIIAGCSSGSGGSTGTNGGPGPVILTDKQPITISPMGSIPLTGVGHQFSLRINNASDDDYTLTKIEMIDPLTGKSALEHMALNSASCEKVAKNSYCVVQVTPKVNKSAAFIVKATLTSGSKKEVVSQMIRVSDKIKARNGIYFDNDINELMASAKGKYSLALPVVLDDDFKSLKVTNGLLNCESNAKGSACTYMLNGSINADKTMIATNIEGVHKSGKSETLLKTDTLIRMNNPNYSHILLSQPEDIVAKPDGSAPNGAKVIAFNLGNQDADINEIQATEGFAAAGNCPAKMLSSSTCTIDVTLAQNEGEISLAGTLKVEYMAGATQKIAKAGLFYDASVLGLGLEITGDENHFMNTLVNTNKQTTYTIRNTGGKALKNIKVNLGAGDLVVVPTPQNLNPCGNDLAANTQCAVTIAYNPTQVKDETLTNLAVSGTFEETGKGTRSIYAEKGLRYSAVQAVSLFTINPSSHSFVVVNDDDDTQEETYSIINASNYPARLSPAKVTPNTINGLTILTGDNKDCGGQLIAGANCNVRAQFKTGEIYNNEVATITIPLSPIAGSAANPAPLELEAVLTSIADANKPSRIEVTTSFPGNNVPPYVTQVNQDVNGNNLIDSIQFAMFANRKVEVNYTFKNTGQGVANNFNVATAGIASAFAVEPAATNCPIGTARAALLAGYSCSVRILIPKEKYFTSGLLYGNGGYMGTLQLEYSYMNMNNGTEPSYEVAQTHPTDVTITTKLVDNANLTAGVTQEADGYRVDLKGVIGDVVVDPFALAPKVVNVSASIKGMNNAQTISCKVTPPTQIGQTICAGIIKLPLAFPVGNHFLDVTIAHDSDPNPANPTIKEHKVVSFTIPDPVNP